MSELPPEQSEPAGSPFVTPGQPPAGYPPGDGSPQYPPAGYPPPGYGQQPPGPPAPYGYYPPAPYLQNAGTNGLAIASMVLGILWLYWVGSVLALIFGYIARSQIKQRHQGGDGMAIAGIVLGWIGIATLILVIVLVAANGN